jgi:hypothetical protein
VPYGLRRAAELGLRITEALEAESGINARYIGVRLEPAGPTQPDAAAAVANS